MFVDKLLHITILRYCAKNIYAFPIVLTTMYLQGLIKRFYVIKYFHFKPKIINDVLNIQSYL